MSTALFDLSDQYEQMLQRGIGLSGEDRQYFIEGRVNDLKNQLPVSPKRILDFGCGTGEASAFLAQVFPGADVVGVDTALPALAHAEKHHGSSRVSFQAVEDLTGQGEFDLCYVNGVFHHILPAERLEAARYIFRALAPGGNFALFENNPWNPGTRLVMKRIPFDRDAILLTAPEVRRLVRQAGFTADGPARFLFYFPNMLRVLRFTESRLVHLPLGAQYYVLAQKGAVPSQVID